MLWRFSPVCAILEPTVCYGGILLATDKPAADSNATRIVHIAGVTLGIFVFLAGIAMIVLVFTWGYGLFQSIDNEMFGVSYVSGLSTPAADGATANAAADVAAATPGGPSLLATGAVLALKLIALLVLGWLGAMVASKGAEMTGVGGLSRGS